MGQKEKLIEKLISGSKSFSFEEAETLLGQLGYNRTNKGKTSGSRVMYVSADGEDKIALHKPHPRKELLEYQTKQLRDHLREAGLI